ncbi:MAG: 3-deoxy-7-phosphoheptulonate synthase [Clostridia bacterium]|nr:MAG: 3-deoxy-7-phosphoheptulonate synthase [Clostridia bacterium]
MIVVMQKEATEADIEAVRERLTAAGFDIHLSPGVARTVIGAIGDKTRIDPASLEAMTGVDKVVPILHPFKLASREFHPENSVVPVTEKIAIGSRAFHIIAGPCAVEGREQLLEAALAVKEAGATMLRGGAYKPRTSPYSFQGLEEEGLKILAEAREASSLPVVTEVMDPRYLSLICEYADVIQVGARNMQNFFLLRELGCVPKPVLLKRGPAATIEEWLLAAEYIIAAGNPNVILCERGIRTFETYTRNTLDLSAIPVVKKLSHLPVIVDPSHGTGKWALVPAMARAALAAGADGLLVEVHPHPGQALSDGPQSLTPANFAAMVNELRALAPVMNRDLA